ncbi:pyocin activator PrtN family protein [Pseudomonas sp. W5-01]|uniref:pyocin activator PrtN family protein n=1 Tax=Pseudomonas sp. W5-01 TaxID=3097454 RepID=UPI00397E3713
MKTLFLLMAQYDGQIIIPLERICSDYFTHLTPDAMKVKVANGQIDLPLVKLENSQKSARGVHVNDLAEYLDARHRAAKAEHDRLMRR